MIKKITNLQKSKKIFYKYLNDPKIPKLIEIFLN